MNTKKRIITIILIYTGALLLVALDQYTKYLSVTNLPLNQEKPIVKGFFYLTNCRNTGADWSMFSGNVDVLAYVSLIATILVAVLIIFSKYPLLSASLGLMLSGAIGNMIDRFRLGYVNDFLDFVIFGYDFPVFNIADICVVVGGGIMLLAVIIYRNEAQLFLRPGFMKKGVRHE